MVCILQIEISLFLPFTNVTLGGARTTGRERAPRSARPNWGNRRSHPDMTRTLRIGCQCSLHLPPRFVQNLGLPAGSCISLHCGMSESQKSFATCPFVSMQEVFL